MAVVIEKLGAVVVAVETPKLIVPLSKTFIKVVEAELTNSKVYPVVDLLPR